MLKYPHGTLLTDGIESTAARGQRWAARVWQRLQSDQKAMQQALPLLARGQCGVCNSVGGTRRFPVRDRRGAVVADTQWRGGRGGGGEVEEDESCLGGGANHQSWPFPK